jgi:hypothetical protein
MSMGHLWEDAGRGTLKYLEGKKPVLVQLCPPQVPCGLIWEQTQASAVRGQ